MSQAFSGGPSYPASFDITLGSSFGVVHLVFDAFNIPDRFVVSFDGSVVVDTGYHGLSVYQNKLRNKLTNLQCACASSTVVLQNYNAMLGDAGYGTASFAKLSATPTASVAVYAPLADTSWNFSVVGFSLCTSFL